MNVVIEDNSEYIKCNNCMITITGTNIKLFHSRICLHKLCESCYSKVFNTENPLHKCTICLKPHELKDYISKQREDLYYENDYKIRHKIMNMYV